MNRAEEARSADSHLLSSRTGYTSPKQRGVNLAKMAALSLLFCHILFHLSSTFAYSQDHLVVGSHNSHGFKKSGEYHKSCIKKHGGIWFAQELWLQEKQLSQLQQLETQFTARSGMESAFSNGLLKGRPFGGVSIA